MINALPANRHHHLHCKSSFDASIEVLFTLADNFAKKSMEEAQEKVVVARGTEDCDFIHITVMDGYIYLIFAF